MQAATATPRSTTHDYNRTRASHNHDPRDTTSDELSESSTVARIASLCRNPENLSSERGLLVQTNDWQKGK